MRIKLYNHPETSDIFQPYMDIFPVSGSVEALGGVLVLPGGGYRIRGDYEGDAVAAKFNELGFHAFVLNYRVAPERYPAPQCDLVRAIKILRANSAKWRLGKLAVLGFSAGAHLAASGTMAALPPAGTQTVMQGDEADNFEAAADALILCYPVISLTAEYAHYGSGKALFGEDSLMEERAKLDMYDHISESTPPSFLWHTADDDAVSVQNSLEFAKKMWACGNLCELHVFPHGYHGRGLGLGHKDLKQWPELAANFLEITAGFLRG